MLVDHPRVRAFITRVRTAHSAAFALHSEVAVALESALVTPHAHRDEVGLVMDMLLVQSYKAHLSVMRLCELGLIEDAATITRRLLELSIQAAYITHPSAPGHRNRRAGQYLAFLWRKLPKRFRQGFPKGVRDQWSSVARSWGRFVPRKARTWGPPQWRTMFEETGNLKTYLQDYSFLSAVAHGRPDEQVFSFSSTTIKLTPHHHGSTLLICSSRYYLGLGLLWNEVHQLLDNKVAGSLLRKLVRWRRPK